LFSFGVVGEKGLVYIAQLFWQSTESGNYLEQLLVVSKGLLIGVGQSNPLSCWHEEFEWLTILWAQSIYTNQQAFPYNQKPLKIIPRIC